MNLLLCYINWNPDPTFFHLGSIPIRYYGLLWIVGIALSYVIVHKQYHDRKIGEKTFEPLFFYCFFGILIGARLGHCRNDSSYRNIPGRLEMDRLYGTCQPWRYYRTDYCFVDVLSQNKNALY